MMNVYIVDAFTTQLFAGNQAGVVLLKDQESFPDETFMKLLAAELKHSETAFVKQLSADTFRIRYFTPVEEVDLCGHATIALFSTLYAEKLISAGIYRAQTLAGNLEIRVEEDCVWMDMASPKELRIFREEESVALYQAFGLDLSHQPLNLIPKVISTGLSDIILPVNSRAALEEAVSNPEAVARLSKAYESVGFHLFCLNDQPAHDVIAYCRNFAPLYGINEESATGTANGALTYYLHQYNLIEPLKENLFIQGEAMGKPSQIRSRLLIEDDRLLIRIGGSAVISLKGHLWDSNE